MNKRTSERNYLALEVGGTKLQAAIGLADGTILEKARATRSGDSVAVRDQLVALARQLDRIGEVCRVGVGFGGPIFRDSGEVAHSYQVDGWDGFNIKSWLQGEFNVDVQCDNDANVAALAEAVNGAGREAARVFYVTLGSGVGGGMVVDGRIYHGAPPGESEIGLMPIDRCGVAVQELCSGWAVDRQLLDAADSEPTGQLRRLINSFKGAEARALPEALHIGIPAAEQIVADVASNLGFAIALAAHLFHPEIVVIGGGLSLVGEPLRAGIERTVELLMTKALKPGPTVKLSELKESVVCVGALLLAAGP